MASAAAAAAAVAAASPFFLTSFSFPKNPPSVKNQIPVSTPLLSLHSPLYCLPISTPSKKLLSFLLFSAVEEIATEGEAGEEIQQGKDESEPKKRLYVVNLPWDMLEPEIKNLFSICGSVADVQVIKQNNGKSRGFAFVTMASVDEARAAIEKFNSFELQGRIIRVEFAKSMTRPPSSLEVATVGATGRKIFVSNLAWKVRSSDLREFFAANYNPVSVRVVFENSMGRSAGYGFVSFATEEETEAAIAALDGKELMGRPVRLKISQRLVKESENLPMAVNGADGKLEAS